MDMIEEFVLRESVDKLKERIAELEKRIACLETRVLGYYQQPAISVPTPTCPYCRMSPHMCQGHNIC